MKRNWETCRDWILHFSGATIQKRIIQISGSGFFPIGAETTTVQIDFEHHFSVGESPLSSRAEPDLQVRLSDGNTELCLLDSKEATFDLVIVTDLLYFDDNFAWQEQIHEFLLSKMRYGTEIVFFHSLDTVVCYPPTGLIELDSWVFEADTDTCEIKRLIRYEELVDSAP